MDVVTKNEFEYDWCSCACDEAKAAARKLANSRWLICAQREDDFWELLVRFLHFTDLRFNLGMTITLLITQDQLQETAEKFPYAQVKHLTETAEPIEAEYCVYCGRIGGEMTISDEAEYARMLNRMDVFWRGIARAVSAFPAHRYMIPIHIRWLPRRANFKKSVMIYPAGFSG